MSRYTRPTRLVMHAVVFLGILSATASVTATPIPFPVPLMAADYSLGLVTVNRSSQPIPAAKSPVSQNLGPSTSGEQVQRTDPVSELFQSYDAASSNADTLRNLASQAGKLDDDDFQQQYAAGLSEYNQNVLGFQKAFAEAASDKGLANYDRTNDIETVLKDFFNLNKGLFNSINDYLPTVPIVGPVVAPIFYNIKCLLDSILDQVEDFSDDSINKLQPQLADILGKMMTKTCRPGVELAGICV